LGDRWKYTGPIFDAHTHIGTIEDIDKMITVEEDFGVSRQLGIVHDEDGFKAAKEKYPDRIVFAKYLSLKDIAQYNVEPVLQQIASLREEGYQLAKTWFGPRWRDWHEVIKGFRIDHPKLEPIFEALEEREIPFIIHVSDPDTYYSNQYKDSEKYGTKQQHLDELKNVISRHPKLMYQVPHMAAQPEIHRLPDLSEWFDKYPNFVVDTASSRWMARELSKDVPKAREFVIKYQDRILFGTDLFARKSNDLDYFSGRYVAQRILWETKERDTPLPFNDADTENTGGTFINGIDLPQEVLRKLYWENANRFYSM
jgi:predicted TIM-barrel fold metal-dependent hydrolase